jgi:hypothetical protein
MGEGNGDGAAATASRHISDIAALPQDYRTLRVSPRGYTSRSRKYGNTLSNPMRTWLIVSRSRIVTVWS